MRLCAVAVWHPFAVRVSSSVAWHAAGVAHVAVMMGYHCRGCNAVHRASLILVGLINLQSLDKFPNCNEYQQQHVSSDHVPPGSIPRDSNDLTVNDVLGGAPHAASQKGMCC